jgi:uncharacterized protein YidB (DUF937 family)
LPQGKRKIFLQRVKERAKEKRKMEFTALRVVGKYLIQGPNTPRDMYAEILEDSNGRFETRCNYKIQGGMGLYSHTGTPYSSEQGALTSLLNGFENAAKGNNNNEWIPS